MTDNSELSHPPDICLLLRTYSEQRWLISQLLPVLRELEQQPSPIPEDQFGAALAYLEVLWLDATTRAAETDAECAKLDSARDQRDGVLYERARRYHASVRRLRVTLAHRVAQLTRLPDELRCHQHAGS